MQDQRTDATSVTHPSPDDDAVDRAYDVWDQYGHGAPESILAAIEHGDVPEARRRARSLADALEALTVPRITLTPAETDLLRREALFWLGVYGESLYGAQREEVDPMLARVDAMARVLRDLDAGALTCDSTSVEFLKHSLDSVNEQIADAQSGMEAGKEARVDEEVVRSVRDLLAKDRLDQHQTLADVMARAEAAR